MGKSPGVFAEAVLGLSTFVKDSTNPLDSVLNPFCNDKHGQKKDISKFLPKKAGNKNDDRDLKAGLSKKLLKFGKDAKNDQSSSKDHSGFNLSKFWKKK